MDDLLDCPACECHCIDIHDHKAMMVLTPDLAHFTVPCPQCGCSVTSIQWIPLDMRDEVCNAALEVGAGMGTAL